MPFWQTLWRPCCNALQVDAHCALRNHEAAAAALHSAAEQDPSFSGSKEYQMLSKQIASIKH